MKKCLYALCAMLGIGFSAQAAVGDTTWVQANVDSLNYFGNFDSTVNFPAPGTSYRNIYMIFTLGKYVCPGSPTYCGDWDYTVQNYLMTPGGDTLELGRLITPYANAGAPRTPWAWTQRYVYDVTDYVSKLHGSNTIRIHYSGYSGGFMADIKFAFVEGMPERDVISIERLWHGSFQYGGATSINTHFPTLTETPPTGAVSADLKFTVTGHGADDNGCCEFLSRNYDVLLNTSIIATTPIWKTCGTNNLYPQSGTWLYDRANWCPGELTKSNIHSLGSVTAGTPFDLGLEFQAYTGTGSLGSYTNEATLIYYGGINNPVDAGIVDVIAPSNNENQFRANPICGSPVIRVRNRGTAAITAMTIEYGVKDSVMQTYNWTGTLNSLNETEITLPALTTLAGMSGATGVFSFVAKINNVNGAADADLSNNTMTTPFVAAPLWPNKIKIVFKTNNEETAPGSGISETKWEIFDLSNTLVASRANVAPSTVFQDTISLPSTGCYRLQVTDGGCNGLQWWANPSSTTDGYLNVKKLSPSTNIPMNGYVYSGQYNNDFGCSYSQYFYAVVPVTSVTNLSEYEMGIEAYPNPARNTVLVELNGLATIKGTIQVTDVMGRVVMHIPCTAVQNQLNIDQLTNGIYTISYTDESGNKLQTRLSVIR